MAYTTADLLKAIGRRSFAPTGQRTFLESDLLDTAWEVMTNEVMPRIISVREEFFVCSVDYAIEAGKSAYPLPARADGMVLRDVWLIDGTSVDPDFPRKEPEDITTDAPGTPNGFYMRGNDIVLHPTPSSTARAIRVFFFLEAPRLVLPAAAGVISAIDSVTHVVTLGAIPSSWVTGNLFDLIKMDGGQDPWVIDQTSLLVSGPAITFASLPTGLRVGDYVALAGETPLVPLPNVFRPALAQGVAAQILSDMNQPGADQTAKKFVVMLDSATKRIAPRTQGAPRTITPSNWW